MRFVIIFNKVYVWIYVINVAKKLNNEHGK